MLGRYDCLHLEPPLTPRVANKVALSSAESSGSAAWHGGLSASSVGLESYPTS